MKVAQARNVTTIQQKFQDVAAPIICINMLQAKRCGLIQNWHILNDCPKTWFRNVQPSLHPLPCHLHVADQGSPSELWCSLSHEKDTHLTTEIAPPLKSTVVMFKALVTLVTLTGHLNWGQLISCHPAD